MTTMHEERLAQLKSELEDQNERWGRAMLTLGLLGDVRIAVRREFFEQLEALARKSIPGPHGLRA
jgi:hypothetical protein